MSGDLSRWMGAVSDVDNADKQAKNPPLFTKLFNGQSIEQTAIQAYTAKKKLEEQRYELKMFLNLTQGPDAYEELLQMEGQIRKDRQKQIYKQQQLRQEILNIIGIILLSLTIIGFLFLVAYMFKQKYYA